jgi:hypothetical protein
MSDFSSQVPAESRYIQGRDDFYILPVNEDLAGGVDQPVTRPERDLNAFGFNRYAALAEVFLKRSMVGMLFVFWLTFESAAMMRIQHRPPGGSCHRRRAIGCQAHCWRTTPTHRSTKGGEHEELGAIILMRCTQ